MLRHLRVRNMLLVGVTLLGLSGAYHALHTAEGVMSVTKGEGTLLAAQYRAPIVNVEAQLFAPGPLTMEQRIRLAAAFDQMRDSLARGSNSHMAKFSARELGQLAAMSRGLGSLGGDDLERVRNNWMRVRSNTFDDASWFRFSEADPVAPADEPRAALSADDRALIAQLEPLLGRIQDQIESGEREAGTLGEPQPSGTVDASVGEAWRSWVGRWNDDLSRLRSFLPEAPGASVAMRVRFAWDGANRALGELSAVPGSVSSGGRPPYQVEWTRRFQNARREIESARGWIAKAVDGRDV